MPNNIKAIQLPDGLTYNLVDDVSGYTKNTGTITRVTTTIGTHTTIDVNDGVVSFKVPTTTSHLVNDSGYVVANDMTTAISTAIAELPEPMVFKGSLGIDGTESSLPIADSTNIGFTYKVITAGTYANQEAKEGDTFISDGRSWVLIPSGDEPSGTVTSITAGTGLTGGTITASGTINHSNSITAQTTQAVYPVTIDAQGHISGYGNAVTITDTKNTAGATDTSNKIFLIGATEQTANPQTYSQDTAYIGTDGFLYSGGEKVLTSLNKTSIINALGYTPYDATNPETYTSNTGTVTSVSTGVGLTGGDITTTGTLKANLVSDTALNDSSLTSVPESINRIYPIRIDKDGKLAVVVPWTNVNSNYLTSASTLDATNLSGTIPSDCYIDTTYSAGTGLELDETTFNIKLGYTTSGNNRAVQADSNSGQLYVIQTDTTYTAGTGLTLTNSAFNHSNSVNVQTTRAVYPITIDAQGHISGYGDAVTIPTVPANIVNTITTTEGMHAPIANQKGNVNLKIPTRTSHLTNDSNFVVRSELDAYLKLTGGTVTGATNFNNSVSIDSLTAGNLVVNGNISAVNGINDFIINAGISNLNADNVRTSNGIWLSTSSITNAATANWGALFNDSRGTPFQLFIPDSSHMYIYKRYYSSNAWSSWAKLSAGDSDKLNGYASDTSATNNTIARRTGSGYIYATYLNQSSGAETPSTSSYIMYANSDGFLRKSTLANINNIINPYEAKLQWGGQNHTGTSGPLDASLVPELGANRFAFAKAAGITVEYSRDTGSTWTNYGLTDAEKTGLFSSGTWVTIGKADSTNKATANGAKYQLLVTLSTNPAGIYTEIKKFAIYVSTSGSNSCTVTIQRALESTPTTFVNVATDVPLSGWSGWNIINVSPFTTYGNTTTTQNGRVRFIFKANGGNTSYLGLQVCKIQAYGGFGWTTPSYMALDGHLYTYDSSQNATFPAQITATQFNGKATQVRDSSNGTAITITYGKSGQSSTSWLASWNGYELGSISPANITAGNASKINGRSITVSTSGPSGGSNGDLWFTYTA